MSAEPLPIFTPADYLARERLAAGKSEFVNGRIHAMAGASPDHNLVVGNLIRELGNELKATPCRTYPSDLRVRVTATGLYTYPDVVVACEPPEFDDEQRDTLLNPTLLVEVLSPSTEAYDRGAKFAHYRRLESLREYWLVSIDRARVERYVRSGREWILTEHSGLDAVVPLSPAGASIRLDEVYARVEFPEEPERQPSAG